MCRERERRGKRAAPEGRELGITRRYLGGGKRASRPVTHIGVRVGEILRGGLPSTDRPPRSVDGLTTIRRSESKPRADVPDFPVWVPV